MRSLLLGAVTAPFNDAQQLANLLGPQLAAFYDCRYNTVSNGGKISAWEDARGSGISPGLIAGGATFPTLDASPTGAGVTTNGTTNYLQSALSSRFDMSGGMTIVHVGAMGGLNYAVLLTNSGVTQYLICANNNTFIQCAYSLDTGGSNVVHADTPVAGSATKRLSFASCSSTPSGVATQTRPYYSAECGGRFRTFKQTNVAQLTGTYQLSIGVNGSNLNAFAAFSTRALLFLRGDVSAEQIRAIRAWATQYHNPTYDTSRSGITFVGDSLTNGTGASSAATAYPGVVMAQTTPTNMTTLYDGVNLGIASRTLAEILALAPILPLRDLNTFRAKDIVCLWAGTNDIAQNGNSSASVIANLIVAANLFRATGAKVVGLPPIPREDTLTSMTAPKLAIVKAVSDWFASTGSTYFDVVVPLYNNPNFNSWTFGASSALNTTYYNADKVHLTDTGYAEIANNATYGVYQAMSNAGIL